MNSLHKKRMGMVMIIAVGLAITTGLILYALKQNLNVFLTPSQLAQTPVAENYHFRLGGLVKRASLQRDKNGLGANFIVTDLQKELRVYYHGILPDLFREGSGVIAEGHLNANGLFIAAQVLAKHDENYMPKNINRIIQDKKA